MEKIKNVWKNIWKKLLVVVVFLLIALGILIVSPNFKKDLNEGKINLIINNNNVTGKMKQPVLISDEGIVYLSKEDIQNYFDGQIYYDKENNQIITTSDTKVAVLSLAEKKMTVNGSEVKLLNGVTKKDGIFYLPISEMGDIYDIEITNIKNEVITLDSLDREFIKADASKDLSVKYNTKLISKTVDRIKQGSKVVVISEKDDFTKVRTENGKIGYVKSDTLTSKITVREKLEKQNQIAGKINLVWDYYSEYVKAPQRSGTIEGINVVSPSFFSLKNTDGLQIIDNASRGGEEYIHWAKANNYKIWGMFSNNSMRERTSKILNSYELRTKMIDSIVSLAVQYQLDGINVDFENMNMADKEVYTRFIVELAPRLREYGIVTSVDVTAPDGSENWSLCFDRDALADASDYLIFMAYDQYGVSSTTPGTTAGHDWVEANIKKFLGQEAVAKEKLILGMPLYTRLWKTDINGKISSNVINMNQILNRIPQDAPKTWDDNTKQYYIEYEAENYKWQMWMEDVNSIKEKLNLINQYELAGGAFWEKDRETEDIWTVTKQVLRNLI